MYGYRPTKESIISRRYTCPRLSVARLLFIFQLLQRSLEEVGLEFLLGFVGLLSCQRDLKKSFMATGWSVVWTYVLFAVVGLGGAWHRLGGDWPAALQPKQINYS